MSTARHPRVNREQPAVHEPPQQDASPAVNEENQPLLATNTGVRLACVMAAMFSPFAVFLCWAEKESRVIRRFAVQSAALLCAHLCGAFLLGVVSILVGKVPYFGFLMTLMGWLIYVSAAVVVLALRIKLMERAWHGRKFDLPLIERMVSRFY